MTEGATDVKTLTFDDLCDAVDTNAAIRAVAKLAPAGGPGDKVFPPTYQGGQYHTETRRVGDETVDTVVLDSVQSQANRMELALLAARNRGELSFPLVVTDFSTTLPHIGRITTLDAPHRIADAIFRESLLDGTPFRDSEPGKRFTSASIASATSLLELCPTALVFGVWDSTGPRGGLGTKFARALVSEIVGFDAVTGFRTGSRIDPLPISAQVPVYVGLDGEWTLSADDAMKDSKGQPTPFKGRTGKGKGKPSELNLGNVTPDIARDDRRNPLPGGVTISHAHQTAVVSLAALRRLHFPVDGQDSADANAAAHTVLTALALAAICYQQREGYDLRSRCLLVPNEPTTYELVPSDGGTASHFALDVDSVRGLFAEAVENARRARLPWGADEIVLRPLPKLVELVRESEKLLARTAPEELDAEQE